MPLKVLVADIDGTLLPVNKIDSTPRELRAEISNFRGRNGLFSYASGRPLNYQQELQRIISSGKPPRDLEGFIYEDGCLRLGTGADYRFGGLSEEDLSIIDALYKKNPNGVFDGMVPLPKAKFTIRRAYVTREFGVDEQPTNEPVLQKAYVGAVRLKDTGEIPESVRISKSHDGLDFTDPSAHKGAPFGKYLEILAASGISPTQVLVIGDAGNDEELIATILSEGGVAAFVGPNQELVQKFGKMGAYIPTRKGPLGTLESIRNFTRYQKTL